MSNDLISDWVTEAEKRLVDLAAAIAAVKAADSDPQRKMHVCFAQAAADHISWGAEDVFIFADEVDAVAGEIQRLRRGYMAAVNALQGEGAF